MNPITLKIILSVSVGGWLLICLLIYKSSRTAAWLAGSTVASCLFCLGATVAASFLVILNRVFFSFESFAGSGLSGWVNDVPLSIKVFCRIGWD